MSAQPAAIVGAKILKEAFSDLAISSTVRRSVGTEQLTPEARIQRYLKRLERVLDRKPEKGDRLAAHDRLAERLIKKSCLDLRNVDLIDKVARGIYASERRTAHEQGHGDNFQQLPYEEVSCDYIRLVHEKHSAQRDTLCRWTDYLQRNDGHYPA